MNLVALLRYDARRVGRWLLLAPVLLTAAVAAGGALVARSPHDGTVPHALLFAVEMAIPLAAGVGVASAVGRDPAVELQLTMPVAYRITVFRRCALTAAASCLVAIAVCGALVVTGWWARWPRTHGVLLGQLTWVAPVCWLAGLGLAAGAALRSPAAAAAVAAAPWLADQVLPDQVQAHHWSRLLYLFATTEGRDADWEPNRLVLLGSSVALVTVAWILLGRPERLLGGEAE
ncbi:MAG TPA: hypothetical protein VGJ07_09700 [Rugosimonospora sp.]|jgi:hypothetical protein